MRVLAIIPARGGSKGVKRKNIKLIDGKPLIAYAIDCAQESKKISYYTVSTDDEEIASVARQYDGPVVMRPPQLAADATPMLPVLIYTLEQVQQEQQLAFDLIILLQPTSPIRSGKDVDRVVTMFEEDPDLDGVISVVKTDDMHPARMYDIDKGGWMHSLVRGGETMSRQSLPAVYYRNGCIYAVRPKAMIDENTVMVKNKKAYIMPAEWLANIDDERDVIVTEALLKLWKKRHENTYY